MENVSEVVDKLVEECTENIDEVKIPGTTLFERRNECKSSCTIYFYNQHWNWSLFYLLQVHES